MATCKDCLPCGVQFNCKKELPCALAQQTVTGTYPYFPNDYPAPPEGQVSVGSIGAESTSEEYDPGSGDPVVFSDVPVNPTISGTLNAVGYISSPLTGGTWYEVAVADGTSPGTVDVTIPYDVYVTLFNQGVFVESTSVVVQTPYFLNLKVFQTL